MKTAIYAGTFDPPSLGHLDIIIRSSLLVDHLTIAVGKNSKKNPVFSNQERVKLLKKLVSKLPNVDVVSFDGLIVEFAKKLKIHTVIRSLRNVNDFNEETLQASMNMKMAKLETLFMIPRDEYRFISSTLIREIGQAGHRLHEFVPREIEAEVFKKLSG